MEKLFLMQKQIKKIVRYKRQIEKELKIKLTFSKENVSIEGDALAEYAAGQAINAMAMGFELKTALILEQEDYMLQTIHIKNYIKPFSPARLKQVKARIIGKKGKALKTISQLSDCGIKLCDNTLAIIGKTENVEIAESSLLSLIRGSKHGNVYSRLEKLEQKGSAEDDLGLKETKAP